MRPSTIVHCFGLLSIFTLFILVAQFLFSSLAEKNVTGVYRVFPVTSIPLIAKIIKQGKGAAAPSESVPAKKPQVILHLKSGSQIHGELLEESENWLSLNIDGSEVGFRRSEIDRIFRAEQP